MRREAERASSVHSRGMRERGPLYPERVLDGHRQDAGLLRRALAALGLVAGSWRRRPGPRRALVGAAALLALVGVGLLAYPAATDLYAERRQSRLEEAFEDPATREAYVTRTIRPGEALTRIQIPRLGVDAIVVRGTTPEVLRAGVGHYEESPLPCGEGNAAIAGHRTTFSKPFADLHRLRPGDEVVVVTPVGRCTYEVMGRPWVTHPTDWSVLEPAGGSVLTLTTCHPLGSADERLIVRARLVASELL